MRSKIDWASLIVGSKFTVFALFYFVFEGNFPSTSPRGAYIWRGDLTDGFLRYRIGGLIFGSLIHGGAYFRNFTVFCKKTIVAILKVKCKTAFLLFCFFAFFFFFFCSSFSSVCF